MSRGAAPEAAGSCAGLPEFKVVLLGVPKVGKTALFRRFASNEFVEDAKATLPGSDCVSSRQLDAATIVLWDTAGQERFRDFVGAYYRNSRAVIVCYSLVDYSTMLQSAFWIADIRQKVPEATIFLCGCKSDLMLEADTGASVAEETVASFADECGIPPSRVFRVSSKTGSCVSELFNAVAAACASAPPAEQPEDFGHSRGSGKIVVRNGRHRARTRCFCM